MFCHTKYMGEHIIQFVWERPKAPPTSHTKYMGTTPGAGGKRTAPSGTSGGTASRGRCLRVHAECNGQE